MGDPDSTRSVAKDLGSTQLQSSPTRNRAVSNQPTRRRKASESNCWLKKLSVERQQFETGRVRVNVVTRERQELVDEPLARDQVLIERVPVGRRVDAIPPIREEGDTLIVPIVEEILVLERRLMLREEVHLKRVHTTERYREQVTLRHQEAVVTRTPNAPEDKASPKADAKVSSK